jgi:hypothetical protein
MSPHGTISRYTNDACRCRKCKDAKRDAARAARARAPRRHGLNGYRAHGCKCEVCTLAGRHAARERYYDRLDTPPRKHGTWSGYVNHRCRCSECVEAMRAYTRAWREKQKAS